ncbi:MAG: hypothetical protein Fues2KO_53670 [Fuerstiella sp.]
MRSASRSLLAALLLLVVADDVAAQQPNAAERSVPAVEQNDIRLPLQATSLLAETWIDGQTRITTLRGGANAEGRAEVRQGDLRLLAEAMVVVESMTDGVNDVHVYAEGRVHFDRHGHWRNMATHLINVQSLEPVAVTASHKPQVEHPTSLMRRALKRIRPGSRQFSAEPISAQTGLEPFRIPQAGPVIPETVDQSRRIQIRPRSSQPMQFDSRIVPGTEPQEQIYILTGGVNVVITGVSRELNGRMVTLGALGLSADRVVIWTQPTDLGGLNPSGSGTIVQSDRTTLQVYLEGNIVIRQGSSRVTATHAFYDVNNDKALMMNAELRSLLPQNDATFRVRAERLRQISADKYHAQNAWTTTSPYGKPGYRLQASDIYVEPGPVSPFTKLDPQTGLPVNGPPMWVTAVNSQFLIGDVPVLSLPRVTAPAEDPNIPIRRAVVKHDRIFGAQVKTVWNLTKILGQGKVEGMQWDLLADYLSERGPALGVEGVYDVQTIFGPANGSASVIWQLDQGVDNLGLDRKSLTPENENRGQAIWRHRQSLAGQSMLFGEIGYVSDRNYRESFHEQEFDTGKDVETLLGLRKDDGLYSGMLMFRTELNEFETSTDWLPRGDAYVFSQPILGNAAYWTGHTMVGYGDVEPGAPPSDPNDPYAFGVLSGVTPASGLVFMTRHQIDAPFNVGPFSVNPFAMGEAAYWDEGTTDNDIERLVGSAGLRVSLSATKIMPFVRNDLLNLNGLAHRTENYVEYRYTDATRNLNEIAQYNEIDDNQTERSRIRQAVQTFGGTVPAEFEPRYYAVRLGAGMWVSAPYHELVEDQQAVRLVSRNRLQTKVGPPGAERIRDWVIWETGATYFPEADRDNFGEDFGLIYGNYRWNISDRTSLLAGGILDLFENSQDVWNVGFLNQRSTRGSLYVGFRQVTAQNFLDSQTLVGSYSYRMSPKWISTGSVAYDLAEGNSRGSSLTFSRVGLDWIVHFGFGIDTSKDNVGIALAVEPRFGPPSPINMSYLLGLDR